MLHDLRPYICTYEDCKDADQQYDSFKQWLAHETNNHRLTRKCMEHPGEIFRSLKGWREHITSQHLENSGTGHLEINTEDSGANDEERACPICTEETVTHEHVGLHLQQLALFALPRSTGLEDELGSDDDASAATAEDLGRYQEDGLETLSLPNEDGRPAEAVYGVDFHDVGNVLADLDPYELAPSNRHIDEDWTIVFNPRLPRQLDVALKHSISLDRSVNCVRFSPDGQYVAVGCYGSAAIFEVETGSKTVEFEHKGIHVHSVCFYSHGHYLVTGARDAMIRVMSTLPTQCRYVDLINILQRFSLYKATASGRLFWPDMGTV